MMMMGVSDWLTLSGMKDTLHPTEIKICVEGKKVSEKCLRLEEIEKIMYRCMFSCV